MRHEPRSAEDESRWVFSQATLIAVDTLHASLKSRWVRDHLPAPLLAQGPASLYYWQWLALPLLALLCAGAGRLLMSVSGALARRLLAKRTVGRASCCLGSHVPSRWRGRSCCSGACCPISRSRSAPRTSSSDCSARSATSRSSGRSCAAVTVAGDEIAEAKWASSRPNIRSITGVGVRLGKVVVAALALMVALSELGYPVTTVIAGLGIGGVALALAAQKTVENLFGSVSILADQPFGVGDTIKVDGVEGTVETIGLRSTRMRTVERTLVIIPNGKLADMRIESLGPRDRIRFAAKLGLARDTDASTIEAIVAALREKVAAHPSVLEKDVFVTSPGSASRRSTSTSRRRSRRRTPPRSRRSARSSCSCACGSWTRKARSSRCRRGTS